MTNTAPKLEPKKVTQIAALPLGGRIKVDPWNNRIEINTSKPVQLVTAREKMPLEVTPVFPHLTRLTIEKETPKTEETPQPSAPAAAISQAADAAAPVN